MPNLRQTTWALAISGLLACGGGGGSSPMAPAPMAASPTPVVSGGPFDLTFTGAAAAHAQQRLSVVVVKDSDGSAVASDYQQVAADGSFSFFWSALLEAGELYHLDFYADHNGNGTCDPAPADHTWQESLGTVTGAVRHHFNHHANFADVCGSF